MKLLKIIAFAWFGLVLIAVDAAPKQVMVLPLTGAIGPAGAEFVSHGLALAEKGDAQLIVLQMDTPGGLDTSMRQIVKAILASSVPVAAFVAPSGARAASAGTYILYSSHIAAMAPGTNLGAATPVQIGLGGPEPERPQKPAQERSPDKAAEKNTASAEPQSAMTKKQVHDAAAYIRGLAQLRGRNAEWGERAVREAVSLSADEALAQKVIDVTARDVPDLLVKINGRKVGTIGGERTLDTAGATVVNIEPDWKTRLLAVITDPSVALILMMIGIYGLFFEFYNPGFVLPGVVGAICLLLALFALQLLPVNYAGLALILLGLSFMVAEVFLASFGVLGIGGIIAFAIGAVMLIDTELPGFGIPLSLIAGLAAITAVFVFSVSGLALKARRRPVVSGQEQLLHSTGVMLEDIQTEGWVRVQGERWWAQSAVPLKCGQRVKVTGRKGLVLSVAPSDAVQKGE
ncbi:MAG: NfeD family protein [Herminiimonas sp.]|nr:NfeD family protein [Herminiimonas sp.]